MTQLTDDCFAFDRALMTLAEATKLLEQRVDCVVAPESVPLRFACNRVLAEDLVAPRDIPPNDNAAVDGYAVRHDDLDPTGETLLPIAGRAAAGHPFAGTTSSGTAIRVFTGATMPDGCDTVIMQEDCQAEADSVRLPAGLTRGANRRRAGEDVRAGATVLAHGSRLRPQDVALAASLGLAVVPAYAKLRVAVFSSGDEVHEPGHPTRAGGIYDANRYMLIALLEGLGAVVTDLGILPDRLATIRRRLAAAAGSHDLIVTSGGMSVGEEDHVKAAVQALGSLHFWQLSIKPGRPLGLGQVAGVPFIGLPGNPVAVMVTFLRVARPMVLRLAGCAEAPPRPLPAIAGFVHKKKAGRREWLRVHLTANGAGTLTVSKFPRQGSGILSSLVETDGLVELPEEQTLIEAGSAVDFYPFAAFR